MLPTPTPMPLLTGSEFNAVTAVVADNSPVLLPVFLAGAAAVTAYFLLPWVLRRSGLL